MVDAPLPEPVVTVVQAIPKGDRGELAVELLTEVGVARVVPWAASRSVAVWKGERAAKSLARWRTTAREASKQARRPWFAEVDGVATTADVVALVAAADLAVVLHEDADRVVGRPARAGGRLGRGGGRPRGRSERRGGGERSRPPARTPYASGPRCCAPRPPAWLRWPRCCRGPRAGVGE